ncbi:MAG TPA: hypothetical protein ENN88_01615 [Candidatus Coatesbacteria bacterium]|nr:hypothetical protein [Candidatus Coatesbacteria bacterium]
MEAIDGARLAGMCAKDWGWWRTATMNLEKLKNFGEEYLEPAERPRVRQRLDRLRELIAERPKGLGWRLRSLIGDRLRWFDEVEEVERD